MFKSEILTSLFIFCFSLLYKIFVISNTSYIFYSDDAIYATLARWFSEGKLLQAFHPFWTPLFPFLISLVHGFISEWETSGRLVSAFAGSLIVVPLFVLVKRTVSTTSAFIFASTIPFALPIFELSLVALSDVLSTFLIISSIVVMFFWAGNRNKHANKLFLLAAFLTGLSYLARPEGLLFFALFLFFAFIFISAQISRKKFEAKRILIIPLFILIFLITISPYVIATKIQLGSWTLSSKGSAQFKQDHAFLLRENGETWAQEVWSVAPNYQSYYFHGGAEYLFKKIDYFIFGFGKKFTAWRDMFSSFFPTWAAFLITIGAVSTLFSKHRLGFLLIQFILFTAITVSVFSAPFADVRYLLWTMPFFVLFFIYGMRNLLLILRLNKKLAGIIASLFPLALTIFDWNLVFNSSSLVNYFNNRYFNPEVINISRYINANKASPVIMMRHEGISWYANGKTVYLPQGNARSVVDYAKRKGVDYLIAWDSEISGEKDLNSLLSDTKLDGLKFLYEAKTKKGSYALYEVSQ